MATFVHTKMYSDQVRFKTASNLLRLVAPLVLVVVQVILLTSHVIGAAVVAFPVLGAVLFVDIKMQSGLRALLTIRQRFASQDDGDGDSQNDADLKKLHVVDVAAVVRTLFAKLRENRADCKFIFKQF